MNSWQVDEGGKGLRAQNKETKNCMLLQRFVQACLGSGSPCKYVGKEGTAIKALELSMWSVLKALDQ